MIKMFQGQNYLSEIVELLKETNRILKTGLIEIDKKLKDISNDTSFISAK